MEEKTRRVSWFETIIGAIGSFFFLLLFISVIHCHLSSNAGPTGCAIATGLMIMSLPGPFVLLCGLGIIQLKSYWRIIKYIAIAWLLIPQLFVLNNNVKHFFHIRSVFINNVLFFLMHIINNVTFFLINCFRR